MSLGLSYSLMDEDVFVFLRNLRELQSIELNYYWVCVALFLFCSLTSLFSISSNSGLPKFFLTSLASNPLPHVTQMCKHAKKLKVCVNGFVG